MTQTRTAEAELLAERAGRFRDAILDVAYGPGGLIIASPRFDTRRPWQEGEDFGALTELYANVLPWGEQSPRPTVAELMYGEDNLFVTGEFLWSQILRHRATGEVEARETARKCFRDLNSIFESSAAIEPGILGKPYGGRGSADMSYDQAAVPVVFYAQYAKELATPQERDVAAAWLERHGDFYLRHDLKMIFCGNWIGGRGMNHPSAMKFLASIYAAYEVTGERRFLDAVADELSALARSGALPFPARDYPANHNLHYWAFLSDYWSRSELAEVFDWKQCIDTYWRALKLSLDDEGFCRAGMLDTQAGTFTPTPEGWIGSNDKKHWNSELGLVFGDPYWSSPTAYLGRGSASALLACFGLLARDHGLDDSAEELARRALLHIEEDDFRYLPMDEHHPDSYAVFSNVFQTHVPAIWLAAYWAGRLRKVW